MPQQKMSCKPCEQKIVDSKKTKIVKTTKKVVKPVTKKVVKPVTKKVVKTRKVVDSVKPKKRSFTLIVNETSVETKGRYLSKTPSSVAKKIGNRVLKTEKKNTIKIKIKETTKDSKKKVFHYQVTRVKDPKTVIKDGKEIVFKYKTTVKKV